MSVVGQQPREMAPATADCGSSFFILFFMHALSSDVERVDDTVTLVEYNLDLIVAIGRR